MVLQILIIWLVLGAIFTGMGLWLSNNILRAFWIGWCCVVAILQISHWWFPIQPTAWLIFVLIAIGGWIFRGREFRWENFKVRLVLAALLFTVFSGSILAIAATLPYFSYDFGLYHWQTVKWYSEYPVILGLGNIHSRLAFNSSYFIYMASLNFSNLGLPAYQLVNGLPTAILFGELFLRFMGVFSDRIKLASVISPLILILMVDNIAATVATSSDYMVNIVTIILALVLADILWDYVYQKGQPEPQILGFVVLVSTGLITLKLSAIFFVVSYILILFLLLRSSLLTRNLKALLPYVFISVVLLGGWLAHGVGLSGYLVYPLTVTSLGSDWAIPASIAQDEVAWIQSWARAPEKKPADVLQNWDWVAPWWHSLAQSREIRVYGFTAVLLFLFSLPAIFLRMDRRELLRVFFLWISVPGITLVAWFFSAPDLRFALSSYYLIVAGGAGLALSTWLLIIRNRVSAGNFQTLTVIGTLCMLLFFVDQGLEVFAFSKGETIAGLPTVTTQIVTLPSGVQVNVPCDRVETGFDDRCWDAPLPCTPYPDEQLTFRNPDVGTQQGFLLSGNILNQREPHDIKLDICESP